MFPEALPKVIRPLGSAASVGCNRKNTRCRSARAFTVQSEGTLRRQVSIMADSGNMGYLRVQWSPSIDETATRTQAIVGTCHSLLATTSSAVLESVGGCVLRASLLPTKAFCEMLTSQVATASLDPLMMQSSNAQLVLSSCGLQMTRCRERPHCLIHGVPGVHLPEPILTSALSGPACLHTCGAQIWAVDTICSPHLQVSSVTSPKTDLLWPTLLS